MIKSFAHKGLKKLFIQDDRSLLNPSHCDRILRILDRLEASEVIEDMALPGFYLHKLSGNRKDIWSIKISGNWRLTFKFEAGNAFDINLEDYH